MLDAFAAARKAVPEARDPRLRIEHAQVVRKQDVARFAELGVIASMQPSHASDDLRGPTPGSVPAGSMEPTPGDGSLEAGVTLAYGSDFPVEIVNPFWGIYAGITRQDAEGKPAGRLAPGAKALTRRDASRFHVGRGLCGLCRVAWAFSSRATGPI